MTFNELLVSVLDRMNISSDDGKRRIMRFLNDRYRRATSSIGLNSSRRTQVSKAATIGNRDITFPSIEKLEAVIDKSTGVDVPLEEISHAEMIDESLITEPPTKYAIQSVTSTGITIRLNCTPATTFTLYADGLALANTQTGVNDSPNFPESFHDLLVFGAMADEYRKMEKQALARDAEMDYERRLSDLRMMLAKSAYQKIYQNKRGEKITFVNTTYVP